MVSHIAVLNLPILGVITVTAYVDHVVLLWMALSLGSTASIPHLLLPVGVAYYNLVRFFFEGKNFSKMILDFCD